MSKMNRRQCLGFMGALAAFPTDATPRPDAQQTRGAAESMAETTTVSNESADWVVTTLAELETAFANLSAGDTVLIRDDGAPYRTRRWLDIDVSDVTVIGRGSQPLIKVADGANVGGIRIGANAHVENVVIDGVSFHGNATNQNQSVTRLHGFIVDDAEHVTIKNCYATRLSPRHKHGRGGSGISARHHASYVTISDNWVDDTGDRGIQFASTNTVVENNVCTNGFDRSIAMTVAEDDNQNYGARHAVIHGNIGYNNSNGSIIGAGGATPATADTNGEVIITDNIGFGDHRGLITLFADFQRLIITGNYGEGGAVDGIEIGRHRFPQDVPDAIVANNMLVDYGEASGHGITVEEGSFHVKVIGNSVKSPSKHGINIKGKSNNPSIVGNSVSGAGRDGINIQGGTGSATVVGNTVQNPGQSCLHLRGRSPRATITGNSLSRAGTDGILLGGLASGTVISSNTISNAQEAGIVSGAEGPTGVFANYIAGNSQARRGKYPALLVSRGTTVAGFNIIGGGRNHDVGIRESANASQGMYSNNYIESDAHANGAFDIRNAASVVHGNYPNHDVHHDLAPRRGTVSVSFEKPYAEKPTLDVVTEAPAMWGVTWVTNASGEYTGAKLSFENANGRVNPTTHVDVK